MEVWQPLLFPEIKNPNPGAFFKDISRSWLLQRIGLNPALVKIILESF
jgi:hypothetical protein